MEKIPLELEKYIFNFISISDSFQEYEINYWKKVFNRSMRIINKNILKDDIKENFIFPFKSVGKSKHHDCVCISKFKVPINKNGDIMISNGNFDSKISHFYLFWGSCNFTIDFNNQLLGKYNRKQLTKIWTMIRILNN